MLDPESESVYLALIVDRMAQRYSKLPSEILSTATTTDLKIMDLADSFVAYRRSIAEKGQPPPPKYTEDQLLNIVKQAKGQK